MKKLFLVLAAGILALSFTSCNSSPADTEIELQGSAKFAFEMKAGWNLGNTLDSNVTGSGTDKKDASTFETSWGLPKTTEAMIQKIAEGGMTTIRLPVSWHNHMENKETYEIDSEWLARVKQIVDWSRDAGLKVIINIHHDNLTESGMNVNAGFCVTKNTSLQEKSVEYINSIWTQVAEYFKDYDENLIFEVLNEPRCIGTGWEWIGGAELSKWNEIICKYEQTALNAIRATGGKNADRYVMVPPYAAAPGLTEGWSLPEDTAENKLLVAVHAYSPYSFAMGSEGNSVETFSNGFATEIEELFTGLYKKYVRKGIGVVMGETSATDKNNTEERLKWFKCYGKQARKRYVPVLLWDNHNTYADVHDKSYYEIGECHGYFNRRNLSWYFPELTDTLIAFYNE